MFSGSQKYSINPSQLQQMQQMRAISSHIPQSHESYVSSANRTSSGNSWFSKWFCSSPYAFFSCLSHFLCCFIFSCGCWGTLFNTFFMLFKNPLHFIVIYIVLWVFDLFFQRTSRLASCLVLEEVVLFFGRMQIAFKIHEWNIAKMPQ